MTFTDSLTLEQLNYVSLSEIKFGNSKLAQN